MSKVSWRLVSETDAESSVIKFVERGTVSHIEFLITNADSTVVTLGARADGGVAIRPLNYAKFALDIRYSTEVTQDKFGKLNSFLTTQLGKPYDDVDILAIGFDQVRDWQDDKAWICSELWTAAMLYAGIIGDVTRCKVNLVTPQDCFLLSAAMFKFEQVV